MRLFLLTFPHVHTEEPSTRVIVVANAGHLLTRNVWAECHHVESPIRVCFYSAIRDGGVFRRWEIPVRVSLLPATKLSVLETD